MRSGIYRITSPSGRSYIGSAVNVQYRWNVHRHLLAKGKHHSRALQRAADKYGLASLAFDVIEECAVSDLIAREQIAIDTLKPRYNCCLIAGSRLGQTHTPEAKAKNAEAHRGKRVVLTPEQRQIRRDRMLGNKFAEGRTWSAEQRAAISKRNKGRLHRGSFASRITPEIVQEVVASYQNGRGLPQLAGDFKACRRAIRQVLVDNGVKIRGNQDHVSKLAPKPI